MENLIEKRDALRDLIKRRRAQMIVHSIIYYEYDDCIWTDHMWQDKANELVEIQKRYPHPIGFYDKEFEGWDGSTGFHLTKLIEWNAKAYYILQISKNRGM